MKRIRLKWIQERYEQLRQLKKLQIAEELKYKDVRRNDLCPCKSGEKYKHCCLIRIQKIY